MVALTQFFSVHYAWFPRGESHTCTIDDFLPHAPLQQLLP